MAVGKLGFLSRFKIDRYPSNFNESKIKEHLQKLEVQ